METPKNTENEFSVNPKFLETPKNEYEFVFEHLGVKYYSLSNDLNIYVERALTAMDIFAQLEMRVSRDFILSHCEAVIASINKGSLTDIAYLVNILKTRTERVTNVNIMYELASVLYFCDGENPYVYDYEFNKKKIKSWKESIDVTSFFLQTPIKDLIPSFNTSEMSFQLYTKLQNKEAIEAWKFHLNVFLKAGISNELTSELNLLISEMESLAN